MTVERMSDTQVMCVFSLDEFGELGFSLTDFNKKISENREFLDALVDHALLQTDLIQEKTEMMMNFSYDVSKKIICVSIDITMSMIAEFFFELLSLDDKPDVGTETDLSKYPEEYKKNYLRYREMLNQMMGITEKSKESSSKSRIILFTLNSIDQAILLSTYLKSEDIESSVLYKHNNKILLVLECIGFNQESLEELILDMRKEHINTSIAAHMAEHYEVLIKDNAVQKLKLIN